jgi:hypothetical protein
MAHYKRRKRRKGGMKGCCGLCMLRKTDGRRNGRILTVQEKKAVLSTRDMLDEIGVSTKGTRLRYANGDMAKRSSKRSPIIRVNVRRKRNI